MASITPEPGRGAARPLLTALLAALVAAAGCSPSGAPVAHPPAAVEAVAFDPAGKVVAAAAGVNVYSWDAGTGKERSTLTGPSAFTCLAFAPDGTRLATGDMKNTVIIWDA